MFPSRSVFIAAGAAFLALLQTSQAQNSTSSGNDTIINLFFIEDDSLGLAGFSDQQLAGSIVTANPSQTVVAVECVGDDIDLAVCGDHPFTVTYGPRTFVYGDRTSNVGATISCSLAESTKSASCSAVLIAPAAVFTNPLMPTSELNSLITASGVALSTATVSGTVMPSDMTQYPVTITAGQAALASASAQSTNPSGNNGSKLVPMLTGILVAVSSLTIVVL